MKKLLILITVVLMLFGCSAAPKEEAEEKTVEYDTGWGLVLPVTEDYREAEAEGARFALKSPGHLIYGDLMMKDLFTIYGKEMEDRMDFLIRITSSPEHSEIVEKENVSYLTYEKEGNAYQIAVFESGDRYLWTVFCTAHPEDLEEFASMAENAVVKEAPRPTVAAGIENIVIMDVPEGFTFQTSNADAYYKMGDAHLVINHFTQEMLEENNVDPTMGEDGASNLFSELTLEVENTYITHSRYEYGNRYFFDYADDDYESAVMALKVAALGADSPIVIDDEECVAKSFPQFHETFNSAVMVGCN